MGRPSKHGSSKRSNGVIGRRHICAVLAAATLCALLPALPVGAAITAASGQIQLIPAPPSVDLGKLTSSTTMKAFNERQRVKLTAPLGIDLKAAGTYTKATQVPAVGSLSIPAGTIVDSHLIHADAPGSPVVFDGTITFSQPILGVIFKSAGLDPTDAQFGAPGTFYSAGRGLRGLELNPDSIIIGTNTVEVRSSSTQAMDELRVFTQSPPLIGATSMSTDHADGKVGAGVATVPVGAIPTSALTASSSTDPAIAASFSQSRLVDTGMRRNDLSQSTLAAVGMRRNALDGIPAGVARLNTVLLADIPVTGGWARLLAGTQFEFSPLQSVTLADVIDLPQVGALTWSQIDLSGTILGEIPTVALALGSLPIASIPLTPALASGTPTQRLQAWCSQLALGGPTCADFGIDPANPASADGVTVASLSVAGANLSNVGIPSIPLKALDLAQTSLGSVGMRRNGMRRNDFTLTPLGALTLGSIPAAGRPTIVNCAAVNCNDLTLTLAAIPPAAIIGTVADLFALQGQSAALDAVLAQLTVNDAFPGVVAPADLAWEDLDLRAASLQNVASPLEPVLTYSVKFTMGVPANVTVDFTMADGFVFTPGSAKLDGVAVAAPTLLAGGILRFALPNVAAGPRTFTIGNRAGTDLGIKSASVKLSATAGTETVQVNASVPITVVESFELNDAPGDFKLLADDTLYVSHISSARDRDFYKFDVTPDQAKSAASAEIVLGNLDHVNQDYDLTLYGPPPAGANRPADESQSSIEDQGLAASPSTDTIAPDLVNDIPVKAGLGAVVAVSANRKVRDGTVPDEKIETGTLAAGTYTVQVSGYNGAFSAKPYVLRMHRTHGIVPPACTARPLQFDAGPAGTLVDPSSYPTGLNTIFLTAPRRFTATFGSSRTDPVQTDIDAVSAMEPQVIGATVPVDSDPAVANAYAAWAADRCSPLAAQKVADAIGALVDRIRAAKPTLRNVVVIGDDSVIPMGRVVDGTAIANERDFAESVNAETTNNELVGSVAGGYVLTDDVYGDPRVIDIENSTRQLYLPRLAVGRLVESPEDIAAALVRFKDSGGRLDPLTAAGSSSFVAGYDFLADGSREIASELATKTTARPSLISESWTSSDLVSALLSGTPPGVASVNAHFDESRLLPAAGNATGSESDLFTVNDVNAAGPNTLLGRLLFSMGCHSGLNVSDVAVGTPSPDWAQTLTGQDQGALWAGNTGYGYGDTDLIAYSEKLMSGFAASLADGHTIGGSLTAAKNAYKAETQPLSPYDEKVMQEVVLYGLPMYTPGAAPAGGGGTVTHPAADSGDSLPLDPQTGTRVASVPISLTLSPTPGPGNLHPNDTGNGRYFDVDGKTVQVQYRPVEPLVSRDVTLPNGTGGLSKLAHGALITGLTSVDELSFDPYYSRPLIDLGAHEGLTEPVGDAVFPASMLRVNSTVDPDGNEVQNLAVVPGQFRPDSGPNAIPGVGTQRLFTNVQTLVHYPLAPSTDFTPPTIERTQGSVINNTVVGITVDTDSTAKRVFVLYKGSGTVGPTAWTGIDLVQTSPNHWTGGGLTTSPDIEFFVQAGDEFGNWGTSNNKASDFLAAKPAPLGGPISVTVPGTQVNGWFTGAVTATVVPAAGRLRTYSLDGDAFAPVPADGKIPVPATASSTLDGIHKLIVSDDIGNTFETTVPIDTVGPTVSAVAEPAADVDGFNAGAVDVTLTATDGGGSGVTQITYSASGAQPIASTTSPGSSKVVTITADGTTTLSFSARDSVGKDGSTKTISVKIDANGPVVACATPSAAWSATDVPIPCTASDAGSGLANPADAAFSLVTSVPTGTETANASTDSRTVADKVGHTSTAGPITGIKVDKLAPTLTSSPTTGVTFTQGQVGAAAVFACADLGSGMVGGSASCTVTINGGTPATSPAAIDTSVLGPVTLVFTAIDAVGNTSTATAVGNVVDTTAPTVLCGVPSSAWSATDVLIGCTASDGSGSGLANPLDATFSLTTNVPAGTETANASTNSRSIADKAGNVATAGPITGIKVDKLAPSLTSSPTGGATFTQNQAGVTAAFTCADLGSGMIGGFASCTVKINGGVPLTSPAPISTAVVGPITLVFTAVDAVGNTSTATATVNVVAPAAAFKVCLDYDASKAVARGTNYLFKLELCDAAGKNISSSAHTLRATNVDGGAAPPVNASGGTLAFTFDSTKHYNYTLKTSGYTVGSHVLNFTVDGVAASTYVAPFKLK